MKSARYVSAIIFILILAAAGAIFFFSPSRQKDKPTSSSGNQKNPQLQNLNTNQAKIMKISSPAFEANADIPAKYACDGENINPALSINDIPSEAKSLAMIMDDPDAPVTGGFVHWVLFNLDPKISEIAENSVPAGATQGKNSGGQSRYTGPCPPSGTHHYHFKLFALDEPLNLDSSATREDVQNAMQDHILDQAELIGLYKRI